MATTQNPTLLDDQMLPGQTYTFSFTLGNWFSLPDSSTIQTDVLNFGPQYIQNLGVSEASGIGLFTNYFNVTFTYAGDGSDVVSDVGAELSTAVAQGSNDTLNFNNAYLGTVGQSTAGDLAKGAQAVQPLLPSTSTLAIILVGALLVVFVMSGGTEVVRRATA